MATEGQVYIVDDDADLRDSLCWLIAGVGLQVASFADGADFIEAYDPNQAGCLITDVRMPVQSGLALQEELAARSIGLPVIVITGHADVPTAVRAMRAGAIDFIEKPFSEQHFLDRIQQALELDARRLRHRIERQQMEARRAKLTTREAEILLLVLDGLTSRKIGEALGIAVKTVDVHRARVLHKFGAANLAELLRMLHGPVPADGELPAPRTI